jgi:glutamine synthetase
MAKDDVKKVLSLIKEKEIRYVDLRFTDTHGKEQHVTIPSSEIDDDFFKEGKMFDGSSIQGWQKIDNSDMVLMPDPSAFYIDPFHDIPTLNIFCDVLDPITMSGYIKDPRSVAERAEAYLKSTGIGDTVFFGPEPEFFVFDDVRFWQDMSGGGYHIDSEEAAWNSGAEIPGGNMGHRPAVKGGYFPVPPVDGTHEIRSHMCEVATEIGLGIEVHHHEVGTASQNEIGFKFNTLTKKADEVQMIKYVIHNVAHNFGKTATFMPKPLVGDNGSGFHCHQSISKGKKNIFAGDGYAGLSQEAIHYIGGIIKHAKAINAFANASTNSYKRLVPGFEAPVLLAYSARNRSASIRIPFTPSPKGKRIEVRFPDASGNPYLMFSAMLMAGLDGIINQIDPGDAMDKDLYDLPPEELKDIPTVASSLEEALNELDKDREFLLMGDVFSNEMIDDYLVLKREEVERLNITTHPVEFLMYYSR